MSLHGNFCFFVHIPCQISWPLILGPGLPESLANGNICFACIFLDHRHECWSWGWGYSIFWWRNFTALSLDKDELKGSIIPEQVWDSPEDKKFNDAQGGYEKWASSHCSDTRSKQNHSKVIWHLLGGTTFKDARKNSRQVDVIVPRQWC